MINDCHHKYLRKKETGKCYVTVPISPTQICKGCTTNDYPSAKLRKELLSPSIGSSQSTSKHSNPKRRHSKCQCPQLIPKAKASLVFSSLGQIKYYPWSRQMPFGYVSWLLKLAFSKRIKQLLQLNILLSIPVSRINSVENYLVWSYE